MPGHRLTLADRREIESAMAEGLSYAEIARRLARPTSTVSREVNRNGGHNRYRAREAHRWAGHRAHRNIARHSSPQPAATEGHDAAVRDVEHRLVEIMSTAGLPRMMAMVLVSLLLSERGALTAADLVARLHVSPASISKAVRHLEHLRFVRREPVIGARRERYVLDEDMWTGIWSARTEAMLTWGTAVSEAAIRLGVATPAGARLDQMSRFLTFLHDEMLHATNRWRQLSAR